MIFYFLVNIVLAQTTFIFHEDQCFEVDVETYGQKFAAKALLSKCKPEKVIKKWIQNPQAPDGDCFEVDEETQGAKYRKNIMDRDCLPKQFLKEWVVMPDGKGVCLLKDPNGDMVIKGNNRECAGEKSEFIWTPNESNPMIGTCYQSDPLTGAVLRTDPKNCRPAKTAFVWIAKEKYPGEGSCYEIDNTAGVKAFSVRTDDKNCVEKELGFKYDNQKGECYRMAQSFDNQVMKLSASAKDCVPQSTSKLFIKESPILGSCYEISSQDNGASYKRKVPNSECRPPEGKWAYELFTFNGIDKCLIVPTKDYNSDYVESVDIKKCTSSTGNYRFALKEDGRGGDCYEKMDRAGEVVERKVLTDKCRPKSVYTTWHNFGEFDGACFEVDKEKGPKGFFYPVDLKFCKPIFTKFVFIKNYGKLGQCFEVDSETGGKKYHRKVGPTPCRENLQRENY